MTNQVISALLEQPWAMMPEALRALCLHAASPLAGGSQRAQTRPATTTGKVAVIPVMGPIVQRLSLMDFLGGATSTQSISNALADANDDASVTQILLEIDSPGGSVYGIQELAEQIRSSKKPVVAFANSLAASAAYWLGSAASEFYMTPGGEVGSIGVYMAHVDVSGALKNDGVNVTLISAGENKVEGNPYQPLSKGAQAFMQERVNDYYGAFTRGVAQGRGTTVSNVRTRMGQGRCYGATQAKAEGMVDGVMTMPTLISHLFKGQSPRHAMAAIAHNRRMREIEILERS